MDRKDFLHRLDIHFLTCSSVVGAAALLAMSNADAAIVYSGAKNIVVPNAKTGLSIDLDTGTFSTTGELSGTDISFLLAHSSSSSVRLKFKGGTAADEAMTVSSTSDHSGAIARLAAGAVVSSGIASSFLAEDGILGASSSSSTTGAWRPGDTGYVGFKFVSAKNTTLFGWAQLAIGPRYKTTVVDWAYEDSGGPIVAGAGKNLAVGLYVQHSDASVSGGPATLVFKRKGGKDLPLTVRYKVEPRSTAVSGEDYTALSGTIIIPQGEKSVALSIPALANPGRTGNRTLELKVLPGDGYTVSRPPKATVTIEN